MVPLDGGRYASSDLNDLYRRIITRNNRLKKLIEQEKIKAVLEYLSKQWTEQQKSSTSASKRSQDNQRPEQDTDQTNQDLINKIEILHLDQPGDLKGRQSLC